MYKEAFDEMFIVIMSDIHRAKDMAREIIERCKRADLFICLGDGSDTFMSLCDEAGVPHTEVLGNCDMFFVNPKPMEIITLDLAGKRIFATHGHRYSVKHTYDTIKYAGLEREADIVLFGHTHEQYMEYVERAGKDNMLLINPGSVADGNFATVDIRNNQILPNLIRFDGIKEYKR